MTSRYLFSYILGFTLIIGEVHTFWERGKQELSNWIIDRYVPMTTQWNVKCVTDQLWYILVFTAIYFYRANRVNKTTVKAFICFAIIDTLFYFWNWKTYGYGYTYLWVAALWLIIYNWNRLLIWK